MPLSLAHFYHLWADGEWELPASEHWAALGAAGWSGPIHVTVVGSKTNREAAKKWLQGQELHPHYLGGYDDGYEHRTLRAVHRYARLSGGAIMYAHTKGAYNTADIEHVWRRYMTDHLIREWVACRTALEQDYDIAGPCYLAGAEAAGHGFLKPIFGGNFWMATCEYLRTLPPLIRPERHEAEIWVCQSYGRAFNTAPFAGW